MKIKLLRIDSLLHIVLAPSFQRVFLTSQGALRPDQLPTKCDSKKMVGNTGEPELGE